MIAWIGLALGIAYVAPPGPVNVATLRWGLVGGFRAAVGIQLGAIVGDALYAVLVLAGGGGIFAHPQARTLATAAGTSLLVYLVYLGWSALRSAWRGVHSSEASIHVEGQHHRVASWVTPWRAVATGVAIAAVNPLAVVFWLAVAGPLTRLDLRDAAAAIGGFIAGALAWAVAFPAAVRWSRSLLQGRLLDYASGLCGAALIACGLALAIAHIRGGG